MYLCVVWFNWVYHFLSFLEFLSFHWARYSYRHRCLDDSHCLDFDFRSYCVTTKIYDSVWIWLHIMMQKFERERDSELRGKVDIALRDNNLFNTLHPLKVKTFNIIFSSHRNTFSRLIGTCQCHSSRTVICHTSKQIACSGKINSLRLLLSTL